MSTYWGYFSKTTGEQSDTWYNHGEKQLAEIYHERKFIRKIIDFGFNSNINVTVDFFGYNYEPLEWLEAREGEDICLINEYGEYKDMPPCASSN
jgi:hypothetical protein